MPVSQGETMPALVGAEKIMHLNHRTKQERVHLIKLSQAIEELVAILGSTTKGTVCIRSTIWLSHGAGISRGKYSVLLPMNRPKLFR